MVSQKRKNLKVKLGKVTEKDIITVSNLVCREVFGIIPSKKHRNKKKYTRKVKYKLDLDF